MRYLIAGFGKFGRIAYERILREWPDSHITVIDTRPIEDFPVLSKVEMLTGDAATILAKNVYDPEDIVVPMTPFNLAAHILLADDASLEWDVIPESVSAEVPNPYPLGKSDLACSKAESVCPDDCPEGPLCTMTGAPRAPLYDELARVHVGDRPLLVLRSSQILPGVGGYEMRALRELSHLIADGLNLVAVSCKCHGIISALRRKARKDGDRQNGGFHRQ